MSIPQKQQKTDTLDAPVRPHILRIVEIRFSNVAVLQGSDSATVAHQISKQAYCSIPVSNTRVYPERYVRTDVVQCQICGSKNDPAVMLLNGVCNKGVVYNIIVWGSHVQYETYNELCRSMHSHVRIKCESVILDVST